MATWSILAAVFMAVCGCSSGCGRGAGAETVRAAETGESGQSARVGVVAGSDAESDSVAESDSETESEADSEAEGRRTTASPLDSPVTHYASVAPSAHDVPEGAPTVGVHLPAGFDSSAPWGVVVFLHGWSGCVRRLVESGRVSCVPGGRAAMAFGLADEHDRAHTNTLLVVPQLSYMERNGRAGRFAEDGVFRAFLEASLRDLASVNGAPALTLDDAHSITLVAHSAGYESALAILDHGGLVELVQHIVLFDALYAGSARFTEWTRARDAHRIVSLYTGERSTNEESHRLTSALLGALGRAAVSEEPVDLTAAIREHRVVIARSPYPHGAIPTRQLTEMLSALPLPAR